MSGTGVLRALTSQQRATEWRPQLEVEQSLGLEEGEIRHYFKRLGEARRSQWTTDARLALERAGVYRLEGHQRGTPRPPRTWWIAFAGEGNACPTFHRSEESHPFAPERPPGEQGVHSTGAQEPSEGGQGSSSTAIPGRSEGVGGTTSTAGPDLEDTVDGDAIICARWALYC